MKKKKNSNKMLIILGVILLAITGFTMFSIIGDDGIVCEFPLGGGSCTYNITLAEAREFSTYNAELSFEAISNGIYEDEQIVEPELIHSRLDSRSDFPPTTYNKKYYLYKIPYDYFDLKISSETDTECTSTETSVSASKVNVEIYGIDDDYTLDGFKVCGQRDSSLCNNFPKDYLARQYAYGGDVFSEILNQRTLPNNEVSNQACNIKIWTLSEITTDLRSSNIYHDTTGFRRDEFIVYTEETTYVPPKAKAVAKVPLVKVSRTRPIYPTDLKIEIEDFEADTMEGEHSTNISTLDLSSVVNFKCNRETNIDECVIPITFTSTTGGIMYVEEIFDVKVVIAGEILEELEEQETNVTIPTNVVGDDIEKEPSVPIATIDEETNEVILNVGSSQTKIKGTTIYIIISLIIVGLGYLIFLKVKKKKK